MFSFKITKIAAIIAVMVTAPAAAQSLPRFAVDHSCFNQWTERGVTDHRMVSFCIRQEQVAYDTLMQTWANISPGVRTLCINQWGGPDGTYRMLEFCVRQQMQAREHTPRFRP